MAAPLSCASVPLPSGVDPLEQATGAAGRGGEYDRFRERRKGVFRESGSQLQLQPPLRRPGGQPTRSARTGRGRAAVPNSTWKRGKYSGRRRFGVRSAQPEWRRLRRRGVSLGCRPHPLGGIGHWHWWLSKLDGLLPFQFARWLTQRARRYRIGPRPHVYIGSPRLQIKREGIAPCI
jgi:hypothetical protein